ncbi:MAG: hypothetical protein M3498_03065 [Deinococcota bacterium]|jgi:hypothetical protein|nr:hypothetical protein [Deinococcota bacterium]
MALRAQGLGRYREGRALFWELSLSLEEGRCLGLMDCEARLERLETELIRLEEALMDPLRLGERDLRRLRARRRELLDELSLLYDAPLPPPAPRLERREGPVRVWLEEEEAGRALLLSNAGLRLRLLGYETGTGHLALGAEEDRCTLLWALQPALRAAARLAFESLGVHVLQVQSELDLREAGFLDAGGGWWLQSRDDFERREGFVRPSERASRRRRPRRRGA